MSCDKTSGHAVGKTQSLALKCSGHNDWKILAHAPACYFNWYRRADLSLFRKSRCFFIASTSNTIWSCVCSVNTEELKTLLMLFFSCYMYWIRKKTRQEGCHKRLLKFPLENRFKAGSHYKSWTTELTRSRSLWILVVALFCFAYFFLKIYCPELWVLCTLPLGFIGSSHYTQLHLC